MASAEGALYPRANIVGCAKAVNELGDLLRAPMQLHCLDLAISVCEGPESGPASQCFGDLVQGLQSYAVTVEELVDAVPPRAASETLCASRFVEETNRARCRVVAEFGHLRDLFNVAKATGIALP
ncbi:MAG: hypothetical protein AAGK77_10760 [Pseudomonadota bacterium]